MEIARAGRRESQILQVPVGTPVREAVRRAGLAPEGVAVLVDDMPTPLDEPLVGPTRLLVVPTFSGG